MVEQKAQEKGMISAKEAAPAPRQFGKQDGLTAGTLGKPPEHLRRALDLVLSHASEGGSVRSYLEQKIAQGLPEKAYRGLLNTAHAIEEIVEAGKGMYSPRYSDPVGDFVHDTQVEIKFIKNSPNLAAMVKEKGADGPRQVARMLGIKTEDRYGGDFWNESLLVQVFKIETNTGVSCTEMIDSVVRHTFLMDSGHNFNLWSHSVCHLFEGYGLLPQRDSFLDDPSRFESAEQLIDESVKRAIRAGSQGNVSRIVEPLFRYNLDKLSAEGLDGDFPFKPKCLEDEAFIRLFGDDYGGDVLKLFLRSKSPREFLTQLIREKLVVEHYSKTRIAELVNMARSSVSTEEAEAYVMKICPGESVALDTLMENIATAKNASEMVAGVYIDVDGTLVRDGKLPEHIIDWIDNKAKSGKKIVIFSGGDPQKQTELLRKLGVPEKFLPVLPKSEFRGKVLEEVYDDTPPEYQGFRALNWSG